MEIFSSFELSEIVQKQNIGMIILAMPLASSKQINHIVNNLEPLRVIVKTMPKMSDLFEGDYSLSKLEEIRIEDLLGREPVPPNEHLLGINLLDKVVAVTGAGGSIGSELCRQIISYGPKKLILVDYSEFALYSIQQELEPHWGDLISALLLSVTDGDSMEMLIRNEQVDTVYHAAAYKHVPLVESNPFAGIINNVLGTKRVLDAAVKAGVSSFT